MSDQVRLPVLRTAWDIWRDVPRAAAAFPFAWAIGILLYALVYYVDSNSGRPTLGEGQGVLSLGWALDCILYAAAALMLVPAALLTHRFLILERKESLAQASGLPMRTLTYAALEVLLVCSWTIPFGIVFSLLSLVADKPLTISGLVLIAWSIVFFGVCFWILFRGALLFPAAALDANREEFLRCWRSTKGWVPRLIAVVVLSPLGPAVLLLIASVYWFGSDGTERSLADLILSALFPAVAAPIWIVFLSHAYRRLAPGPDQPPVLNSDAPL